jgi:hypothetical protein
MADLVPVDHDPFAGDQAAMQPETFVPPFLSDWVKQAAPKDVDILKKTAQPIINAMMAPGQAFASTTPIPTEQMIKPAMDMAAMTTLGAATLPAEANSLRTGMSFPLYHGSPTAGLKEILPSERGALGPGAYFTPADNVAQRYGSNVYQLPEKERNIFNGLGDRYGKYEDWKADNSALMNAVEPDKRDQLKGIIEKMWTSDGYPLYSRIAQMYKDEGKAQDLFKRAGFEGVAGHADGPEINLFDKQIAGALQSQPNPADMVNAIRGGQTPPTGG